MQSNLDEALEAHRRLRSEMDDRAAELEARAVSLRQALESCTSELHTIKGKRAALDKIELLYREIFTGAADGGAEVAAANLNRLFIPKRGGRPSESQKPLRARIGPQRYRMFSWLRMVDVGCTIDELANVTGLPAKRVRDQMTSDVQLGTVQQVGERYLLTDAGRDLLDRFETYKKSKGEPLPALDGPLGDDDREDDETETPEGEQQG